MDIKIHYKIEIIAYHYFFGNTYLHHHVILDIVSCFSLESIYCQHSNLNLLQNQMQIL